MDKHNLHDQTEKRDAETVDQAMQQINDGNFSSARLLLSDVVTRAPEKYVYEWEEAGELYVKFWDFEAFMHYVIWQNARMPNWQNAGAPIRKVNWVPNAYPRACYHLGCLEIEAKRYDAALYYLKLGKKLEPTNPLLTIELAHAFVLGRYFFSDDKDLTIIELSVAINFYEQVHEPGPHVREEHVALALRGIGYAQIEMGWLDMATKSYKKSQDYEPDNEVAANQLEYISRILDEKRASPLLSVSKSANPEHEEGSRQDDIDANHWSIWSRIGFSLQTDLEFLELMAEAVKNGIPIDAAHGTYVKWSTDAGIELWAHVNQFGFMQLNPHFSGDAKMRILLESQDDPEYSGSGFSGGSFYGMANPRGNRTDDELEFNTPDYYLHQSLKLPVVTDVQLSAFAHELHAFAGEDEYQAFMRRIGLPFAVFAVESFIPSGRLPPPPEADWGDYWEGPASTNPIFVGRVLETSLLTNPVTGVAFYWAKVRIRGGEVDVVVDPEVLQGTLVKGGVVYGKFWLSGRLLRAE